MTVAQKYFGLVLSALFILLSYRASFATELIMVESPICEWCEIWEEEVGVIYKLTPQGKRAPVRRLSLENLEKNSLEISSPVTFTPTFILSSDQREVGRITGYPGESHFWALLDDLLKHLPENSDDLCADPRIKVKNKRNILGNHLC